MITVFTLCASNYLAGAKVLGESVKRHCPDVDFVIGLVDRLPKELDPSYCAPFEIIPVESLGLESFEEMSRKYKIVELCTAVKPWYFELLYARDPHTDVVIYLDPDILVYRSLAPLVHTLSRANIVITPHSCTYDDSSTNIFYEKAMLRKGIYNLGFIATRRSAETAKFLRWWQVRLRDHCYWRPDDGMFFDQLWVALAPVYFEGVYVEKDPGYNMSFWNVFERRLTVREGTRIVNGNHDLVFFHFSGFKPLDPVASISRGYPMPSLEERPDLRDVYEEYRRLLLENDVAEIKQLPCAFAATKKKTIAGLAGWLKQSAREAYQCLPPAVKNAVRRLVSFLVDND